MKTKILPVLSLLAAMTLVACGGGKNDPSKGGNKSNTTQKSSTSKSSAHKHTYGDTYQSDEEGHWKMTTCTEHEPQAGTKEEHTFVEDKTDPEYVAATCKDPGVKVEKCSVCGYKKKTNVAPNYQLHNFGERTWTKTVATYDKTALSATTEMQIKKCSVCQEDDVILNALDFVNLDDAGKGVDGVKFNKVSDGTRLKMASNNQYVEYKFTLDKDFAGSLYLFGVIDYWKTENNQNHLKGFYPSTSPSGNEGTTCNIAVELNGSAVEVTNKNSYLDMNIPDAETPVGDGYSGFGLAEVGAIELEAGEHTLRYARKGSYNMDITEIHMIGALTKHTPKAYEWEADGEAVGVVHKEKCTTDANKKAYRFDVSEATGWNQGGTKMNEKDQTKANSKSTWTVGADVIPDGNYRVDFVVKMTSDHSARHWFNEAKWNEEHPDDKITLPVSNPDSTSEDPFRYFVELNGTAAYPTTTATWGEQGLSNTAFKTANEVIRSVAATGLTTFALRHGNIGYSLIIESVRLIAL